eukprot:CAMPEP_0201713874 /NCGR_PEP_ID=MMETSP0593-20130828/558_1 /ASSEMBLY_ACC=CAM_ASM_000672 /TAXON_ID=267983 /ORGANISM="Skeletonema japonicum, Strain CCMP2506" /LENGTH=416 /DNA_ID=CAMNT_0048203079 /DNA_START=20 /DNA_END=1270 /DNA_ORIENTATION=+
MVECVICLEPAKKPVKLPCKHQFCGECFEGWRSKYVLSSESTEIFERTCPSCRAPIPPSKEQVSVLKATRLMMQKYERDGEQNTPDYLQLCGDLKKIETQIGEDWDGVTVLEEESPEQEVAMPGYIVHKRDLKTFMRWFNAANPAGLDRANAKLPAEMRSMSLLTFAILMPSHNIDLMRYLLLRGSNVNKKSDSGATPLSAVCEIGVSISSSLDPGQAVEAAKLLLSWGAEYDSDRGSMGSKECCLARAQAQSNVELVSILQSKLCGRRCELVNLSSLSEMNGRTCIVEEYLKSSKQYTVTVLGRRKEEIIVRPDNLKRRDRTLQDCDYYIEFNNGRFIRNDFDSKDDYQAFLSAMNRDEQPPAVDPNAEAKAEQAAADLLAELGIEDDVTEKKAKAQSKSGKKSKNKKKGKKGKK